MAKSSDPDVRPHLRVAPLPAGSQGFLFELDSDGQPLPGLDDFFSEAPMVSVAEVPDLDFERSRRRFTQGA